MTVIKKGLSPLLSVVLLVAVTLSIGVFVSGWLSSTAKTQTEQVTANNDVTCNYASLNAQNAVFNQSGNNEIKFDITNTGTKDLTISKIRVTDNSSNTELLNTSYYLYAGDGYTITETLSSLTDVYSIRIITSECPAGSLTIEDDEITEY